MRPGAQCSRLHLRVENSHFTELWQEQVLGLSPQLNSHFDDTASARAEEMKSFSCLLLLLHTNNTSGNYQILLNENLKIIVQGEVVGRSGPVPWLLPLEHL